MSLATSPSNLPVWAVADALRDHLQRTGRVVLSAPTGSGKTTQVPQMLLRDQARGQLPPGQLWVCQPRRIAARMVATRIAQELGEPVGETIGYQTRFEAKHSPCTQVLFLTEGLLLRRLAENPQLTGVAAVLLDEFHERSTALDLALALLRRLQQGPRPDLKLLVMSATLAIEALAAYLDAPTLEAHGRAYPVEIRHLQAPSGKPVWALAADLLGQQLEAMATGQSADLGDAMIFMPGAGEIQRTYQACGDLPEIRAGRALLLPLHGQLPAADQDRAVAPDPRGRRRVIVATNVAETSLTIDGVGLVIDSGLARIDRVVRYGELSVTELAIERISRASADQRAGRAGRTRPGLCLRLWTRNDHFDRPEHTAPQIHRTDPADALMLLRGGGVSEPATRFPWFDAPAPDALADAEERLDRWGLTRAHRLSPRGKIAAALPLPPGLAAFVTQARDLGPEVAAHALMWAALLDSSPITRRQGFDPRRAAIATDLAPRPFPGDLVLLTHLLQWSSERRFAEDALSRLGLDRSRCEDAWRSAGQLARLLNTRLDAAQTAYTQETEQRLLALLIALLPERLAVLRPGPERSVALPGLRDATLDPGSCLEKPGPIFVGSVLRLGPAARGSDVQLGLAVALDPAWLGDQVPERFARTRELQWDAERQAVMIATSETFDGMPLRRHIGPPEKADRQAAAGLLAEKLAEHPDLHPDWQPGSPAMQWVARCRFVAHHFPQQQPITFDATDLAVLMTELATGCTRIEQVTRRSLLAALQEGLSWEEKQCVERMAPTRLPLEAHDRRGNRVHLSLHYDEDHPENPPTGAARIQEFFGYRGHPTLAGGRAAVVLEILGPNFRPVQRTSDLPGFWQRLYPSVRAELKRRYPKHDWRDDPAGP